MKKILSTLFVLFILTLNLFLPISVFAYFEYQNKNGDKTTICEMPDILSCVTELKQLCGSTTTASCVETQDKCSYMQVDPVCPPSDVHNIDINKNSGDSSVYKLLAPIGNFVEAPDNIGKYFNIIISTAIGLCAVLAVIMIVIGGIQYMGDESIFGKTQAKDRIGKAILGLLIALGSYALLNTINPDLLGGDINIKQVSVAIDPEIHGDEPHSPINGKFCNGKFTANQTWPVPPTGEEQLIRNSLLEKGITVNKKACTSVGESNCTSVAGLDTTKVVALKNKCGSNCPIEITGGTECWLHSNKTEHLPGNSIVDLNFSRSPSLVKYIEEGSKKTISSYKDFPIFTKDGMSFLKESNHYHVISW